MADALYRFTSNMSSYASWHTWPSSYYFNGKTYIVYNGHDSGVGYPWIAAFTHSTKTFGPEHQVSNLTNDPYDLGHSSPTIMVTNTGRILVFWGCHDSPLKRAMSTDYNNEAAWTILPDIGTSVSYQQIVKDAANNIYLLLRQDADPLYWALYLSTDDGLTFTDIAHPLIGEPGYDVSLYNDSIEYDSFRNRIWFGWTRLNNASGHLEDIFSAYYNIADGRMYTVQNVPLGTSITWDQNPACQACSSAQEVIQVRVRVDSNGYPNLIWFTNGPENANKSWFVRWTGTSWTTPVWVNQTLATGAGDLEIEKGGVLVYITDYQGAFVYYISTDYGATWTLHEDSSVPNCLGNHFVQNHQDNLKVIFMDPTNSATYNSEGYLMALGASGPAQPPGGGTIIATTSALWLLLGLGAAALYLLYRNQK